MYIKVMSLDRLNEYEKWGNSGMDYVWAVGVFVILTLVFAVLQKVLVKLTEKFVAKTKTELDDALIAMVKKIKPPFYMFVAFYAALLYLNIEGVAETAVRVILITWITYQTVQSIQIFIDMYVGRRITKTNERSAESIIHIIHNLTSIILWTIGLLFVLSNIGVNVNSLVAGLGIGGIAVALAAQNVLGDLFSSMAIYFDKPFSPGDFVTMGEFKGTVQKIGIKTTRIKSVTGEEIVASNNELTSATLRNFGRLSERRKLFKLGVVYETSSEKLKKIPEIVKEIIGGHDKVRFDRMHFEAFDDWALNFEIVYFVQDKKYEVYMDTHQAILFAIKEAFEEEGIEMAYPTRVVYNKQS